MLHFRGLDSAKVIIAVLDGRNARGFADRFILREKIESEGGDDGSDHVTTP
jgi:hypothetical protein